MHKLALLITLSIVQLSNDDSKIVIAEYLRFGNHLILYSNGEYLITSHVNSYKGRYIMNNDSTSITLFPTKPSMNEQCLNAKLRKSKRKKSSIIKIKNSGKMDFWINLDNQWLRVTHDTIIKHVNKLEYYSNILGHHIIYPDSNTVSLRVEKGSKCRYTLFRGFDYFPNQNTVCMIKNDTLMFSDDHGMNIFVKVK